MLEIEGLTKRFGGVAALDGVRMRVSAGRVHALLGENGAGKSTLLKCLSGVHRPDGGAMRLGGERFAPHDPREAERAGLRFVHQEINLVPGFTAYENAFVGRPYPRRRGLIAWRAMRARFAEVRDRHGLDLDLDMPVGRLSVAKCQIVEILRALMDEARILVLDEPTASLSQSEAAMLHRVVRRLAGEGRAIIYVSHRLDEIFEVADDYTVLRNGRTVGEGSLKSTTREGIVSLMAGEEIVDAAPEVHHRRGTPVLELSGFRPAPSRPLVDITAYQGEVIGLYGVVGSGRSTFLKAAWGAKPNASGRIAVNGNAMPPAGIAARLAAGVAYVPEDRRNSGLIMQHSVLDNVVLPRLETCRAAKPLPLISWRKARAGARTVLARLNVRYRRLDHRVSTLSGGNQQKIMMGRWPAETTRLLLADEPTRGVDVRSKAEIHGMCRRLAEGGAAVIFVTSDMEELLALATRILVMAGGSIVLDTPNRNVTRQSILDAVFSRPGSTPTEALGGAE